MFSTIGRRQTLYSQIRKFHKITRVQLNGGGDARSAYIELTFTKDSLKLPLVWLRDHCRSDAAYNWKTNQRKSTAENLFRLATVNKR